MLHVQLLLRLDIGICLEAVDFMGIYLGELEIGVGVVIITFD